MGTCQSGFQLNHISRLTNWSDVIAPPKTRSTRSHWQMVWLLAQGLPSERVAAITGYTANCVRTVA
jgi:hypothetical protein